MFRRTSRPTLRWTLGRVLQVVRQGAADGERVDAGSLPVSYTHLTLPTSDLV